MSKKKEQVMFMVCPKCKSIYEVSRIVDPAFTLKYPGSKNGNSVKIQNKIEFSVYCQQDRCSSGGVGPALQEVPAIFNKLFSTLIKVDATPALFLHYLAEDDNNKFNVTINISLAFNETVKFKAFKKWLETNYSLKSAEMPKTTTVWYAEKNLIFATPPMSYGEIVEDNTTINALSTGKLHYDCGDLILEILNLYNVIASFTKDLKSWEEKYKKTVSKRKKVIESSDPKEKDANLSSKKDKTKQKKKSESKESTKKDS